METSLTSCGVLTECLLASRDGRGEDVKWEMSVELRPPYLYRYLGRKALGVESEDHIRQRFAELRARGAPLSRIADEIGCDISTILNWDRERSGETRTPDSQALPTTPPRSRVAIVIASIVLGLSLLVSIFSWASCIGNVRQARRAQSYAGPRHYVEDRYTVSAVEQSMHDYGQDLTRIALAQGVVGAISAMVAITCGLLLREYTNDGKRNTGHRTSH